MPLEELAEERDILITHRITDLLHGPVIALQQALGSSHPQLLQVDQRTISRSLLEAADEIAQAHSHAASRCIERKGPLKVFVQPFLGA